MGLNDISQTPCTELSGNMAVWCYSFPMVFLFFLLKRWLLACPGKDHSPQPLKIAGGRWGAGSLPPQHLVATCQHLGTCAELTNIPLCAAKLSLFAVHLRCLFMGKLRRMAPAKGRLASREVHGKSQGSPEAQVGCKTKTRCGTPFPAHLNCATSQIACEQERYPPLLGSAVSHTNLSSGREAIAVLNCSNLGDDYIGILNWCILSLHLCFAKDCTDRQAFIFINK